LSAPTSTTAGPDTTTDPAPVASGEFRVGRHRPNHVYCITPGNEDLDQDEEVAVALVPGFGPIIAAALNQYLRPTADASTPDTAEPTPAAASPAEATAPTA
jgi:hypothetical protein